MINVFTLRKFTLLLLSEVRVNEKYFVNKKAQMVQRDNVLKRDFLSNLPRGNFIDKLS